jgi:formylglycine-generating enzyme required for sulfatase activity
MKPPSSVCSAEAAADEHGGGRLPARKRRSIPLRKCFIAGTAAALACLALACSALPSREPLRADMVFVPAGDFLMGSDLNPPGDESPQHRLFLDDFWIDRLEVTNAEYRECVSAGRCSEPADLRAFSDPTFGSYPVVYVTWFQAEAFCAWRGKRLPSEAEWEKAARGTDGRSYPWGDVMQSDLLNAGGMSNGPRAVGSLPQGASPYGALDMAGNVWEWVEDWYAAYPGSAYTSDFYGEKYKVVRGGSWNHPVQDARTFHRDIASPWRALAVVGFRCAASP